MLFLFQLISVLCFDVTPQRFNAVGGRLNSAVRSNYNMCGDAV